MLQSLSKRNDVVKNNRKWWFRGLKNFLKIFIHKPKFIFLGDKPQKNCLILSNHAGAKGPLKAELYFKQPLRIWGTYEMNSGLKMVYKYLSETYYYQKHHWKKFFAKSFSLIAAPFANLFYKGLRLIPTYRDTRLRNTIKESVNAIKEGQKIIIFPEDSSQGYFDTLTKYFSGFAFLAKTCYKEGIDLDIFATYYKKSENVYIFDKPIKYSKCVDLGLTGDKLADEMCRRTNELSMLDLTGYIPQRFD